MNKMKKIKDKLTAIRTRWNREESENRANIEKTKRKISTLEEALDEAEYPEEYIHAQRTLMAAQSELNFYSNQRAKFQHVLSDQEYRDSCREINAEKDSMLNYHRAAIRAEFDNLLKMIDKYQEEAQDIDETRLLLFELGGKSSQLYSRMSVKDLALDDQTQRMFDMFSQFCQFYSSQCVKQNNMKRIPVRRYE